MHCAFLLSVSCFPGASCISHQCTDRIAYVFVVHAITDLVNIAVSGTCTWESWMCLQKLLITTTSVFLAKEPLLQIAIALMLFFATNLAHAYAHPYVSAAEDRMEMSTLCAEFVVLFTGLLFFGE